MFRRSREILTNFTVAIALLASLDAVVRQDMSVAHAALLALSAESGIVHAQGTIPDPETPAPDITPTIEYTATLAIETPQITPEGTITATPTIDVTNPLTPTVIAPPTVTPSAPDVMDVLSLEVTDENGNPLAGVPVRGLRTNPVLSVSSETDSTGSFEIVSQIPGADSLIIGTMGANEAQSVDFSFQTTQAAYESAILELADPYLSAQLVINFINDPEAVLAAFQPEFQLKITGTADIENHSLAIAEQPQGVSVQIDDFETNGSVTLQRPETATAANQEAAQATSSEVIIFTSAEDNDGFSITINGKQTVQIDNTNFSAGTLSFQPERDYNSQTGQLSVSIDIDNNGVPEQKVSIPVEGEVDSIQTFLPLVMTQK